MSLGFLRCGGGGREGGGVVMVFGSGVGGGGIAAMGWLVASGLDAGVGVLCGERQRERETGVDMVGIVSYFFEE